MSVVILLFKVFPVTPQVSFVNESRYSWLLAVYLPRLGALIHFAAIGVAAKRVVLQQLLHVFANDTRSCGGATRQVP
jgi:hypothetical protein